VVDTGHAALGGVDAAALIRRHPERVVHVHAKDVRRPVFERIMSEQRSFLDGVLAGMFTAPGDGGLDFAPMLRALADIRYDGWIVIEAEQDPKLADPRVFGRLGLRTLRAAAAAAGLVASSAAVE
jgi:inosose dehydratase